MAKNGGKIITAVRAAITPAVEEMGFSLWDVEYKKIGADYHLIVTIDKADKEGGVDIDDCEAVHHAIDPLLDEADPIEEAYYLDVSSPGLERELRTKEHFLAMQGETITVKLFALLCGRREFTGILSCKEDASEIVLEEKGQSYRIPFSSIAKAHVAFDF